MGNKDAYLYHEVSMFKLWHGIMFADDDAGKR